MTADSAGCADEDERIVGPNWLGSTGRGQIPRPSNTDPLPIDRRNCYGCCQGSDCQLTAYRIGRVIRFKVSDLDAYIDSSRIEPGTITYLYPERPRDLDAG